MENVVTHLLPSRPYIALALFAALATSVMDVGAQSADPPKPMALRAVMEKLDRGMQDVTGAISKENWATVAELAPKIAKHAEPPLSEKMRILAWLGTDAGKFRGFDGQVHDATTSMGEAAKRGDGQAVIVNFAKAQQSCLACHQSFRKPFQEHFYEKR